MLRQKKINIIIILSISFLAISCSTEFNVKNVSGYYEPVDHQNSYEGLFLKNNLTFTHITVIEKDTFCNFGSWELVNDNTQSIWLSSFSWENRYLLDEYSAESSPYFKWYNGVLDIGLLQLNFEKEASKPPNLKLFQTFKDCK